MDTIVSELSTDDIHHLTDLLSRRPDYGIARPSQRWQTRQREKMEILPKILLRDKNPFRRLTLKFVDRIDAELMPPAAILCSSHEGLNTYIIRKIFLLLATEVTIHTDRLRSYPGKNPALAAFITRIDSINAYWVSKEMFQNLFGAAPHDDRFVRVESGCEACILGAIGANGRILADLRAQLVMRNDNNRNPKPGHKKRPTPRLLRVVEGWIGHLRPQDAEKVRKSSEYLLMDLREVQPALKEHKRHSQRPGTYQELRMSMDGLQLREVRGRTKSHRRRKTRDGIPLPAPDTQSSAAQRNLAALHRDFSTAKSVYRADSVLNEVPESVPTNYYEYNQLLQERQRPGAPEPRQGHASGSQSVEEPRESFVNRFEREIPLHARGEGDPFNPYQYQVPDGGYDDTYEAEFDERDPAAEARSEAKVSEWFMANHTRVNLNEVGEDDVHPAFQQQGQSACGSLYTKLSALPPPLRLKADVYTPARSEWTKADNAGAKQGDEHGLDPNSDAWTDATVYTTADAADEVDFSGAPPMPAMPSRYQQHGQADHSGTGHSTATAVESHGSRTSRLVPSIAPGEFPQASAIGPSPNQSTIAFPQYNEHAQDHSADRYNTPAQPQAAGEVPYYPPAPPMKPMGKPNKKYLFQDSEAGSRVTATNKRYLKQHRGIQEVPPDKNPFLRQDRIRSPDRQQNPTHQPPQMSTPPGTNESVSPRGPPGGGGRSGGVGRAVNGTPLTRQELMREEQAWRESFGGSHELRPDDSASNVDWKKKRDSVTTLGAFIRKGAGGS